MKAEKLDQFQTEKPANIYFTNKHYKLLLPLLKKDQEEEFSPAYYAVMYEEGLGGLKINLKKAISYYEKAVQKTVYAHGLERLLYYFRAASEFAHTQKFEEMLQLAEENSIAIDYDLLEIPHPKLLAKEGFFRKLFKSKK